MAAALVILPTITIQRHAVALGTVWPVTVPTLGIHRHVVTPSVPQAALVILPTIHLSRTVYAPAVGGFSPGTASLTFAIQRGPHRFDITKAEVTPAG